MSTFTLYLHEVIDLDPLNDDGSVNLVKRDKRLGIDSYPVFESNYRPALNQKIVDHYYNQEIGMETVEMFRFAMRRKLNEIMPYYNKLYASEQLTFDPMKSVDMKTITTGSVDATTDNKSNSSTESDNTSDSRAVFSDTPQTQLSGLGDYATNATDANAQTKVTAEAEETALSTNKADTLNESTVQGYSAMPAELLTSYRNALLNLDMSVINELRECFMMVWANGNTFTQNNYGGLYS